MADGSEWTLETIESCDDYETVESELVSDGYTYFAGTSRSNCDFDGADCVRDIFKAADEIAVRQPWERMDEWDDDTLLFAYSVEEDDCTNWFIEKGREDDLRQAYLYELRSLLKTHDLPESDVEPCEEDLNSNGCLVHYISVDGEERFSPCLVRTYKKYLRNHHRPTSQLRNEDIKAYLLRLGDECFREFDGLSYSFIALDPEDVTGSLKRFGRKPKRPELFVWATDWCMPGRPGLGEVRNSERLMIFGNRVVPEYRTRLKGIYSVEARKKALEDQKLKWEYGFLSLYGKKGWYAVKPLCDFQDFHVGDHRGGAVYILRYRTIQTLIEGDLLVTTPLLDTIPELKKSFDRSTPFSEIKASLLPYNPVWHLHETSDDRYSATCCRRIGSGDVKQELITAAAMLRDEDWIRLMSDVNTGKFERKSVTSSLDGFQINLPMIPRSIRAERRSIDLAAMHTETIGESEIAFYHPCDWHNCMGMDVQAPTWICKEPYQSLVIAAMTVIDGEYVEVLEDLGKGLFSIERKEEEPGEFSSRFRVSSDNEVKILAGARQWLIDRINHLAFEGRNCWRKINLLISFGGRTWLSPQFQRLWVSIGIESPGYSIKDFADEIGQHEEIDIGNEIFTYVQVFDDAFERMEIPFHKRYKVSQGEELGASIYSHPPRKKRLVWFDNQPAPEFEEYCAETESFIEKRRMLRRLGAEWVYGTLDETGRKGWWAWLERKID